MFEVEKAKIEDIPVILKIFRDCTDEMIKQGVNQWDHTYPTAEVFKKDIEAQQVFIIKEKDSILATITLNGEQDEQYENIKWSFSSNKVLVIHRLAVSPTAQGKGLGKLLCNFSESFGKEHGFEVIRLDAYSGNKVSCGMYEKLEYKKAEGFCWFHGNDLPFYCFEKLLI